MTHPLSAGTPTDAASDARFAPFLATSTGIRRRYTQPTGSVEINAKRGGASAWAGSAIAAA